jgi:hypothetical protein
MCACAPTLADNACMVLSPAELELDVPSSPARTKMTTRSRQHPATWLWVPITVAGMLGIVACASTPPAPTAALDAATQAIASAERSDASQHAAGELNQARGKLASANAEVAKKEMISAERFALESRAEAELASARAGVAKARITNDEMKRSTSTLIEEMQRNSGDTP